MNAATNEQGYEAELAAINSSGGLVIENGVALDTGKVYAANSGRFGNPETLNEELTEWLNGRQRHMAAANESRFNQAHPQQFLSQYATGWTDEQKLDALIEFIAPSVQVSEKFEYREWLNEQAFMSELSTEDDRREIGGNFKEVSYGSIMTQARTYNHGLTIRLDRDAIKNIQNPEQMYTGILMQRTKRTHARRTSAAAIAAATNTAYTWSTAAAKDPDQDILTEKKLCKDSSGIGPNRLLYTDGAWLKRSLSHRAQVTAGGFASAPKTVEELAAWFRMQVYVSEEVYQNAATTKASVFGSSDYAILFRALPGASPMDPSNFKNFWSPSTSGQRYSVYVQPFGVKFIDITVEHNSYLATTSTVGVRKGTIS